MLRRLVVRSIFVVGCPDDIVLAAIRRGTEVDARSSKECNQCFAENSTGVPGRSVWELRKAVEIEVAAGPRAA